MILQVFADESSEFLNGQEQFIVVGGYVSTPDEWTKFRKEWGAVLARYEVPNFHFMEFHSPEKCAESDSPYFEWSWEKRDNFFYDLAMTIGFGLVPVGGSHPLNDPRIEALKIDPYKQLFAAFFNDTREAVIGRWPSFRGADTSDKMSFVCDKSSKSWMQSFHEVHDYFSEQDHRFGPLTFEDDKNPEFYGLQAADFYTAIYRQAAYAQNQTGQARKLRVIDVLLFRALTGPGTEIIDPQIDARVFKLIIDTFREDEKRKKKEWKAQGTKGKQYYVTDHIPSVWPDLFQKIMALKISIENAATQPLK